MTAIATEALKFNFAELLHKEIINTSDSNHFYIGIGKSDQYDSASDNTIDPVRVKRENLPFTVHVPNPHECLCFV